MVLFISTCPQHVTIHEFDCVPENLNKPENQRRSHRTQKQIIREAAAEDKQGAGAYYARRRREF